MKFDIRNSFQSVKRVTKLIPTFFIQNSTLALRDNFPLPDSDYLGGESDGYVYRTIFGGASLEVSFGMIKQFLFEEGYKDIPVPENANELKLFKLSSRNKQILMFEDNGYVHNPIKILFPNDRRKKKTLILEIYNERAPKHLLRFYNKLTEKELEETEAIPISVSEVEPED